MMKYLLGCIFVVLFVPELATAQKPTLKLYSLFALDGALAIPVIEENSTDLFTFRWFSPAVLIPRNKGHYDEIELTDLRYQRAPDFETDTKFSIGLRYEHGKRFNKNGNSSMSFRAGPSLRSYFGLELLNDSNILGYAVENQVYGLALAINPHVTYRIYKNLIFDFSPYCEVANFTTRLEYVYDPFIDEEQRQSVDFYFDGLTIFLRAGIGWQF